MGAPGWPCPSTGPFSSTPLFSISHLVFTIYLTSIAEISLLFPTLVTPVWSCLPHCLPGPRDQFPVHLPALAAPSEPVSRLPGGFIINADWATRPPAERASAISCRPRRALPAPPHGPSLPSLPAIQPPLTPCSRCYPGQQSCFWLSMQNVAWLTASAVRVPPALGMLCFSLCAAGVASGPSPDTPRRPLLRSLLRWAPRGLTPAGTCSVCLVSAQPGGH